MSFYISKSILDVASRTRLGVVELAGCEVGYGHTSLDDMRLRVVSRVRREIRGAAALKSVPQIAGFDQLRSFFEGEIRRQSTRAERLLEGILQGEPMPVENDAEDTCTLLMLFYKLPVILVDPTALRGDIGLALGRPGSSLEIVESRESLSTDGKLVFADDLGEFTSPYAQGKRGLVTERSQNLLLIGVFPENVGDSIVKDFIRRSSNWMVSLCGGEVVQEGMVGEAEAGQ